MPVYPGSVVGTFTRQEGWTDKSVLMDFFAEQSDVDLLYQVWGEHPEWPEPLEYRGGEKGITCEMVLEASGADLCPAERGNKEKAFIRAFVRKPAVAKRLLRIAHESAGR